MIKELYEIKNDEYAAVFTNSKLNATRKRHIVKKGFRVYDHENIGIAYAEGDCAHEEKFSKAVEMLDYKLPYMPQPEKNKKVHMDMTIGSKEPDKHEFTEECRELIDQLDKKFPNILFSNSIKIVEDEYSLKNDADLDLYFKDRYYLGEIGIKIRNGINILDGAIPYKSRSFEPKDILESTARIYENYQNVISIKEGQSYPFIISTIDLFNVYYGFINTCFERELNGRYFASGSSLFSNRIGEQALNKDFTLRQYSDPHKYIGRPFFDSEGTIIESGEIDFIKNGKIIRPYTDKSACRESGLELTGSATGQPDEIPTMGGIGGVGIPKIRPIGSTIVGNGKTIDELLGGDRGIFVGFSLGGSYNNMGGFAFPVQFGLIYENGSFIGRTQELMCSTNIFDMYGKDWRGLAKNNLLPSSFHDYMVIDMTAEKNG